MAIVRRTTRREFLAAGAGGVAGAAFLAGCSRPARSDERPARSTRPVLRTLGRTGLVVPVVSVGSAYEPGVLSAALDAGMRYVHTSSSYAEQNHERMLAGVLRGRPRESFVIGSSPDLPDYRFCRRRSVGGPRDQRRSCRHRAVHRGQPGASRPRVPRHLLPGVDQRSRDGPARAVHEGVRAAEAPGQDPFHRASRRTATNRRSSGPP